MQELHAALVGARRLMHSARVVVVTGAGASFCAGADIAHMRSMMGATEQQNVADALLLARCLRTLDELDKPVIARVNGNVFGGGVGLVACADIAIGVETAKFALTEVRLGIVPAVISPYVVAAIGNRHARRLFLTAAPFEAAEARSIGLLHFTATAEQLDALVAEQVDHLLRGGPEALRAAKKLVRRVAQLGDRDVLGEETARAARTSAGEPGRSRGAVGIPGTPQAELASGRVKESANIPTEPAQRFPGCHAAGGKLVAITGAGRGIGRAMALAFAQKRSNLALLDLNQADLDRTRELCEAEPSAPAPTSAMSRAKTTCRTRSTPSCATSAAST